MKTAMEILLGEQTIAFNSLLAHIAGEALGGLFLSQCCFASRTHGDDDGWFYTTAKQWRESTLMTRCDMERIRKKLVEKNLLSYKVRGQSHKTYYRVNWEILEKLIVEFGEKRSKNKQMRQDNISAKNERLKNAQMPPDNISKCGVAAFANAARQHTKRELREKEKELNNNLSVEKDTRNIKEAIAEDAAAMTKEQAQAQLAVLFKRSQKYTPTAKPQQPTAKRLSNDELEDLARSDGLTQGYDPSNNAELRH